jgi:hypothetical protein
MQVSDANTSINFRAQNINKIKQNRWKQCLKLSTAIMLMLYFEKVVKFG